MIAGVDSHKDTLAVAVIDTTGRVVEQREFANEAIGHAGLSALARARGVTRLGIEGSANYGWSAAMHLLAAGVAVVEVPPLMTSRERLTKPGSGKTDAVDSVAIARITAREDSLPPVRPMHGAAAELRVLTDYRDQLVTERTALANRVHIDLCWLRPGYQHQVPKLTHTQHLHAALALLRDDPGLRAQVTRRRLDRMVAITTEVKELKAQIDAAVTATGTGLTRLYGVGPLVAARILAEVDDVRRYPSRHHFATANGTAPIPASSGRTARHRLNRGGNRQLNRALYTIAITQIRADTEGRAYYQRKRAEGKSGREALRCLKRRLSDIVYKTMRADLDPQPARPDQGHSAPPQRGGERRVGTGTPTNGPRASNGTEFAVPHPALRASQTPTPTAPTTVDEEEI